MKRLFITALLFIFGACTTPANTRVYIDTSQTPIAQCSFDYDHCQLLAQAAWPVTQSEIRKRPYLRYKLKAQQAYMIDCLQKKGYKIIITEEVKSDVPATLEYPDGTIRKGWPVPIDN